MRVSAFIERMDSVELEIDPDRFVEFYEIEWKEYLEDDEPTDELKMDFIKESISEIGPEEFMLSKEDLEIGVLSVLNTDNEFNVSVRRL